MILELKYKQHAEDLNRINTFQQEGGFIEKKEAPKTYRLFKLFCLKDRIFSAFMSRAKCPIPILTGKGEESKQKWVQSFPPYFKIFMAGLSKNDFTKQTAHIKTFNVGNAITIASTYSTLRSSSEYTSYQAI